MPRPCSVVRHRSARLEASCYLQRANSHTRRLRQGLPTPLQRVPLAHAQRRFAAGIEQRCGCTAGFSSHLASTSSCCPTSLSYPPPAQKNRSSSSFLILHLFGENWLVESPLSSAPGFVRGWWPGGAGLGCPSHPCSLGECPLAIHSLRSSGGFLFLI